MIKLSDHLYIEPMGRILEQERQASAVKGRQKRYAAARNSRLNSGWTTNPESANFALRQGTRIMRSRAREMASDTPHGKKYLSMCRSNIIGQNGIQLQVRARKADNTLDADLNKRVEMAFQEWTYAKTCSVSGKLDWLGAQRLFVTQLARDGEVLVQKVKANNEFGFALRFIDVSFLDEGFNRMLPNGNRILMSIEVDDSYKPIAYWLTPPATELEFHRDLRPYPVRVPAEEIIHRFLIQEDESQVRGLTWFAAGLLQGKSLASYVESVIVASRVGAMNLGFIEEDFATEGEYMGQEDDEGRETDPVINFAPGGFTKLNPGQKVNSWKPEQPTQNHSAFKKSMELDLATALDVPYFDLTGDMEAVNFSSARVGLNQSRDNWRTLQDFVGSMFCRDVYHAWLPNALLSGKLDVTTDEYARIFNPYWRARGWGNIDPVKEINASVTALENNLTTWTAELADKGIDLVDHLEERRQEQELAAQYGVKLEVAKQPMPAQAPSNPDNEADDGTQPPAPTRNYVNGQSFEEFEQ